MESIHLNIDLSNKDCHICSEEFNRFRSSVSHCSQCNYSLCSECLLSHRQKHEQDMVQIQDQYNELINKINAKEKYINDTSNDAIEIVVNWYERLINDLIESQTQIIDNIQNERDRAREELTQLDLNTQAIQKDIQPLNENMDIKSIQSKLNDLALKLSNYQITKDIHLPNSHTFQPRYQISYQFQNSSFIEEEDWDLEATTSTQTTTPLFFSDTSQTFVPPKEEEEEEDHFQWSEELEETNEKNSEYLLDPRFYYLGISRYLNSDIHLIASNGNDLLCYSHQTKQLISIDDGNINPLVLQWYHGHIIQLVWFDNLKSFVALTDTNRYEIYSIESTYNLRLKIRLRTCLPQTTDDIIKDQIFLRTDDCHIYLYYERTDGRKRLRLLNPTFECVQTYSIDQCLQRDEHLHDNGLVLGLGVNQEHIVLFVRSLEDTRLLVFNKSKMSFIRRIILSHRYSQLPFIVYFLSLSSFFIIDQIDHLLRFYNYEKQINQINLSPSKINLDSQYSSIVLMNDGSLFLSNNTKNLIQLIRNDLSDYLL